MYHPTIDEIKQIENCGNLVPVYREISTDLETPVSTYMKVARPPYSFLLESINIGNRSARYSFIGTEPYDVIKTGPNQKYGCVDPLIPIEAALNQINLVDISDMEGFAGGAVGYLSYDTSIYFEKIPSPDIL